MNKSDLMKAAHKIAKQTVAIVGDYLISLKLALKTVWGKMMKPVLTEDQEKRAWAKAAMRVKLAKKYGEIKSESDYIVVCREDVLDEDAEIEKRKQEEVEKKAKQAEASKKASGGRYIELASVAERDGLNHGRAWFCGERDIETKGAKPEFEDMLICYVYP